jgi:uncharacterized protein (TIGR02246 family)
MRANKVSSGKEEIMAPKAGSIQAVNEIFMSTFARGDAAGMGGLYTEKGQLLPSNSDFVTGRKAIQDFWKGAMDMGIKNAKLQTIELEEHGDSAYEVGKYTLSGVGGQIMDQGKYIVIWKKQGGEWKLHRDIWNTSLPAPE